MRVFENLLPVIFFARLKQRQLFDNLILNNPLMKKHVIRWSPWDRYAGVFGPICLRRLHTSRIEKVSRDVLKIDWKPISVFPEEGRRFR